MALQNIRYRMGDTIPLPYVIQEFNLATGLYEEFDLTGCGVRVNMWSEKTQEYAIEFASCNIIDAKLGTVEYVWKTGETDNDGWYRLKWIVTTPSGKLVSFPEQTYQTLWIFDDLIT